MKTAKLLLPLVCSFIMASAQITETFDRQGKFSSEEILSDLQNNCWDFRGLEILTGTDFAINGDASLITKKDSRQSNFLTPILSVSREVSISFDLRYINPSKGRQEIILSLTDVHNKLVQELDRVVLNNRIPAINRFSNRYPVYTPGAYKLQISFLNSDQDARIIIDELAISAGSFYPGGCNRPPISTSDLITGKANRTASGSILANDSEPDNEPVSVFVISPSPNGTVSILPDNSFTFSPYPGFSGDETYFSYQLCDKGLPSLCGEETLVRIKFPSAAIIPFSLIDFRGAYQSNGTVLLSWTTNFETNSAFFDIERSTDGIKWSNVGRMINQGTSGNQNRYNFQDDAGKRIALKKDLYYRLKQVDQNGTVAVSRLLLVRVYNSAAVKMVSVSPNPAVNDIGVNIELNEAAMVSMKVRNSAGIEVLRKLVKTSSGRHYYQIEGSSAIPPGAYILELVINSRERLIVKLIKE